MTSLNTFIPGVNTNFSTELNQNFEDLLHLSEQYFDKKGAFGGFTESYQIIEDDISLVNSFSSDKKFKVEYFLRNTGSSNASTSYQLQIIDKADESVIYSESVSGRYSSSDIHSVVITVPGSSTRTFRIEVKKGDSNNVINQYRYLSIYGVRSDI